MVFHASAWMEAVLEVSPELGRWPTLGIAFLLGSFTVATLSDLKRLSAQREFLEVWVLFTGAILAFNIWETASLGWDLWQVVAIKWGLILVLGLFSWQGVGGIFNLARADVFACTATAALLSPLLILVFWVLLKLTALVLRPILARGRPYWPFMPVVSVATLIVLAAAVLLP